jgi:hypothetical protein
MTSIRTTSIFRLLVVFCALSVGWPDALLLAQQGPVLDVPAGTRVRLSMGKGESPTLEVRSPNAWVSSAAPGAVVTIDPITGVMTTVVPGPNGTRLATKTNPDGSIVSTRVERAGSRASIVSTTDPKTGITTTVTTDANGRQVVTTSETRLEPDGRRRLIASDDRGTRTETIVNADGSSLTAETDRNGRTTRIAAGPDGALNVFDVNADGSITETARAADGTTLSLTVDQQGNFARAEATFPDGSDIREDAAGLTARVIDDQQRSFETTLLPDGTVVSEVRDATGEVIRRKDDREKRQRDIEASKATAKKLQKDYDAAIARGDKAAALRIQQEQDRHEQASMALLSVTEEEQATMDRQQALRDAIMTDVIASARGEAQQKVDADSSQDLKEAITSGTKYVSIGSAMQQDTKASTRLADFQVAFSEAKDHRLRQRLDDPKTTPEERKIISDLLKLSTAQKEAAEEQLTSNARLTAIGYTVDAALVATGVGTAYLGARAAATAVGTQAAAAATRTAATQGSRGVLASAASAMNRQVVQSKLAQSMGASGVISGGVDAGVQLWRTGTIDPDEVVRAAFAGAVFGGATHTAFARASRAGAASAAGGVRPQGPVRLTAPAGTAAPIPDALPAPPSSTRPTGPTGTSIVPGRGPRDPRAAGSDNLTGGLFDRPEFRNLPSKPPVGSEFDDLLNRYRTPEPQAAPAQMQPASQPPRQTPTRQTPPRETTPRRAEVPDRPAGPNEETDIFVNGRRRTPTPDRKLGPNEKTDVVPALQRPAQPAPTARPPASRTEPSPFDQDTVILPREPKPIAPKEPWDEATVVLSPEQSARVGAPRPRIVYPGEPGYVRPDVTAPQSGSAERTPAAPSAGAPPSTAARRADTATRPPDAGSGVAGASPRRVRNGVPDKFQPQFDRAMEIVDDAIATNPRFANVDREAIANQIKLHAPSGQSAEELAAFALNYNAPTGARMTPDAPRPARAPIPPTAPRPAPAPIPPTAPQPPLQFGPDDLVYGPAANGELRALADRAGGRLLNDLPKPADSTFREFTIDTLNAASQSGRMVRFDLTHMDDVAGLLNRTGPHADKITSIELRHIRDNWSRFRHMTRFYRNGREVPPPWQQ